MASDVDPPGLLHSPTLPHRACWPRLEDHAAEISRLGVHSVVEIASVERRCVGAPGLAARVKHWCATWGSPGVEEEDVLVRARYSMLVDTSIPAWQRVGGVCVCVGGGGGAVFSFALRLLHAL